MKKKLTIIATLLFLSSVMPFAQILGGKIIKTPTRNYTLTVNSNTKQYSVIIDGKLIKGNRITLPSGKHTILVKANKFEDYRTTINLTRSITLNATLKPIKVIQVKSAFLSVIIPPEIVNDSTNGAINQIMVFDNGRLLNGFNFELRPGNHTIRIESGAFAMEGTYNFSPGKRYKIEPVMYLQFGQ